MENETARSTQLTKPETEMNNIPFPEKEISGTECAWCIDGRCGEHSSKGPQMMGGSLSPVVIAAIVDNRALDEDFLDSKFTTLTENNFGLGVHTDDHAHAEGCGFAKNLDGIFNTAKDQSEGIKSLILQVLNSNSEIFTDVSPYIQALDVAAAKLQDYEHKFNFAGSDLINHSQSQGAQVVELEGAHVEQAAYINLKPNITLDVARANANGQPVFNLDLWALNQQAAALGVDQLQATALGLMLYVATEMVLVEKGDPTKRLPVMINA